MLRTLESAVGLLILPFWLVFVGAYMAAEKCHLIKQRNIHAELIDADHWRMPR